MACLLPQFNYFAGSFSINFKTHTPTLLPKGGDRINFHAQCILSTTSPTMAVINTENLQFQLLNFHSNPTSSNKVFFHKLLILPSPLLKGGGIRMKKRILGVVSCIAGNGSTAAQESKGLNTLAHSNSIGAGRHWTNSAASDSIIVGNRKEDIVSDPEVETLEQVVTEQFLRHMQKLMYRLNTNTIEMQLVKWRFGLEDGTMKSLEETGELMGIDRISIGSIQSKIFRRLKNRKTTKDIVVDLDAETLEQVLMRQLLIQELQNLMNTLSPIERQIVKWRYGLEDGRKKTLQETGAAIMGMRPEAVGLIESSAFQESRSEKRTKDNDSDLETKTLEQVLTERLQRHEVQKRLNTLLSSKERQVLRWLYGQEDGRIYTLLEIGEMLGIGNVKAANIATKAHQKLNIENTARELLPYLLFINPAYIR